ncbi:MAG: hypothetical protein B7Z37_14730 [Verrucomicrobia bacterium 12-59-8]|nr:MAG: hypothetical protein B7Z37_14730 [Verrucomicrobia bacterium 12-59-8]
MGVHPGRGDHAFPSPEPASTRYEASVQNHGRLCQPTLRFPIPDLIVEVLSPSTEGRDRGIKFQDYALHGVAEYWIIDPVTDSVELYRLAGEVYPPTERHTEGMLCSDAIAGFEIPVRAIFDEAENLRMLREIVTTEA